MNIDHYEAVGILKAAGSLIALRVEREEYPDGKLQDTYGNEPPSISKIFPPPLQTPPNDNIRQDNKDQVQLSYDGGQDNVNFETPHANGMPQVSTLFGLM